MSGVWWRWGAWGGEGGWTDKCASLEKPPGLNVTILRDQGEKSLHFGIPGCPMCADKREREGESEVVGVGGGGLGSGIRPVLVYLIKQSAPKALLCMQDDSLPSFPPQTGSFTSRTTRAGRSASMV